MHMRRLIALFSLFFALFIFANEAQAQSGNTHVYVNAQELNTQQLNYLQSLIGQVHPGSYYLDQAGNFGVEGQYPHVNLRRAVQAARQNHTPQSAQTSPYTNSGNSGYFRKEGSNRIYYHQNNGPLILGVRGGVAYQGN